MFIQHNMAAMNASRQLGINSNNRAKRARNLGSGYKINIAADNAAGLSISEKMRGQIRGLERAAQNAQEGSDFIQVADGAMNEVHAILHRMRELSVQALNDTYVEADRAAMAAEFDQLQSEIDKISDDTEYNALGVFEDHAPAYYQIAGNRKWDAAQQHSIVSPANDLVIHLGSSHSPSDYTITINDGIYTTQELIDEIEDAFYNMSPSNPGLSLEFTDHGYCNLNFESPDGSPVEIDTVEGDLAYLIYDCYNGNTSASLLGTTAFEGDWPLSITTGQNDELSFYVENTDGSGTSKVDIVIPGDDYSRSELIEFLNNELATKAPGVTAKEYGEQCIQITGGSEKSITGLKGNMFKYETSSPIYTSVFYDNSKYGVSGNEPAVITGKAYYSTSSSYKTTPFKITDDNNTMRVSLDGGITYQTVTLTNNEYTLSGLITELNNQFKNAGVDASFSASDSTYLQPGNGGVFGYYQSLIMTSGIEGSGSKIIFDTTDAVTQKAYETLFCDTNYEYKLATYQYYYIGSNLIGIPSLTGAITVDNTDSNLTINITNSDSSQNTTFSIDAAGTYTSLSDLVSSLNSKLSAYQKGLIEFVSSNNHLAIKALNPDVSDISLTSTEAYKQLFTGTSVSANSEYKTAEGYERYPQGSTSPDYKEASITLNNAIPSDSTTIDSSNNDIRFLLNNNWVNVTLTSGTYTRSGLVNELNNQLLKKGVAVEATLSGNALTLTTKRTGTEQSNIKLELSTGWSDGWKAFVGTKTTTTNPTSDEKTVIQGRNDFSTITIDDTNNTLGITYNGATSAAVKTETITIAKGDYTMAEMVKELQNKINTAIGLTDNGNPKVIVSSTSSGLRLTASSPGYKLFSLDKNTSFYQKVLDKSVTNTVTNTPTITDGKHVFSEAYIVGREDLTDEPVQIVTGANDKFIFDFTYTNPTDSSKDYVETFELTIPEGIYPGTNGADGIAQAIQTQLEAALKDKGLDSTFESNVTVGGHSTGVVGSNDSKALQITIKEKSGANADSGTYVIDGIRGSASYFTFYKTTGKPIPSYVTGTEDLSDGVTFTAENNVLTFSADGTNYSYTFTEGEYTAEEFLQMFNDMLDNGDDSGQRAPLEATLEDGRLKISHKIFGNHTIENVSGTAKGVVFYHEESRETLEAFMLQIGANSGQAIELPRLRINTSALGINTQLLFPDQNMLIKHYHA